MWLRNISVEGQGSCPRGKKQTERCVALHGEGKQEPRGMDGQSPQHSQEDAALEAASLSGLSLKMKTRGAFPDLGRQCPWVCLSLEMASTSASSICLRPELMQCTKYSRYFSFIYFLLH